jgi:hypothetical protein
MDRAGWLGVCVGVVVLAGCGGGGGSPTGGIAPGSISQSGLSGQTGQAVITVTWPANRASGSYNSVRAVISESHRQVAAGLLSRPAQGTTSTLSLGGLPAGTLTVVQTAFANTDGTGASQPLGSETVKISPGAITHISLGATDGTHFVSPNGDDSAPGTSAQPWRTLQRAADVVRPGSTVVIAAGEYAGGIKINRGGTAAAPITFRAQNPDTAIVLGDQTSQPDAILITKAQWVVIDGLTVTRGKRGIRVDQSDHVTIRRCRALDNELQGIFSDYSDDLLIEFNECAGTRKQHGIYVSNGGDRPIVRNNISRDNARCGIQLNGDGKMVRAELGARGDGVIDGAIVANNVIYRCGLELPNSAAAINLASVRNSLIASNLLFNNLGSGVALFNDNTPGAVQWGSKRNQVLHNTVYFRPGEGRWCVSLKNGSTDNSVMNNLLVGGQRGALEFDGRSSFMSDGNLLFSQAGPAVATNADKASYYSLAEWRAQGGQDHYSVAADPAFPPPLSPTDLRPGSGSPALGIGVPLPAGLKDLDGRPFGAGGRWDAGCFAGS